MREADPLLGVPPPPAPPTASARSHGQSRLLQPLETLLGY